MWVKATNGRAYNLGTALEIECIGSGGNFSIQAAFPRQAGERPPEPGTSAALRTSVVLIKGLSKAEAETKFQAILDGLGAMQLS